MNKQSVDQAVSLMADRVVAIHHDQCNISWLASNDGCWLEQQVLAGKWSMSQSSQPCSHQSVCVRSDLVARWTDVFF
ncbi:MULTISPECIES: hypothetical protein [unclassified Oceanobacter]|uniref:hypothetical protein n=1 Tax=unclassified Oceanobacter TaxID=2620260 RepID=UPI0026E46710|nr:MULTISPECIES: hypothetical protein [unclassified Oceanobacter]MDO6680986.1 hypothetical protein [Oceanobacter sp. 5_MG-2023]MDP2504442.1 hypothetical protein [Oceanobacter sp. 3_MG-2023]